MTQFYSRNDVNYSGDVYSIPFDYIDKKEVKVYIDDELWTKWHFLSEHQLTLDEVPEDIRYSNIISVRRETNIEDKVVTYDNNSLLNKENLNKSQDQLLYAVQEIYDNNTQFAIDIRAEVDEKVERVSEAVEKLDMIDASVETSVQKAQEATEQAQIATEKAEATLNTYNEAMAEINTLRQDSVDEVNQLVADHTDDLNALDQLIKKDADAIINRVGLNMFDTKITDCILENEKAVGWALQGTYVNGAVYPDFYAKCLEEYNEATETETVNGVTVKVNSNGHKFYDIADKTVIDEFYNSLGSAWFYGIDTDNERIFLPRDNFFAIKGIAPVVGNGMTLGLTDGTKNGALYEASQGYVALNAGLSGYGVPVGTSAGSTSDFNSNNYMGVTTDPTKSGIEAHIEANEGKYLYICVGNTIVNEDQIDVSKVLSEAVLRSSLEQVQVVVETYKNGASWYRVWSDGWCEQGGKGTLVSGVYTVTFLKPFVDTNYTASSIAVGSGDNFYFNNPNNIIDKTVSSMKIRVYNNTGLPSDWQASGYIW